MSNFLNLKIRLKDGATFDHVVVTLLSLGYMWKVSKGFDVTKVKTIFTHTDGSIKWSTMDEDSGDWYKHPGTLATIKDGEIQILPEELSPEHKEFISVLQKVGVTDPIVWDSETNEPVGQTHKIYYKLFLREYRLRTRRKCNHQWAGKSENQYCLKCGANDD